MTLNQPILGGGRPKSSEYRKYEIIEQLLKTSDSDKAQKTMQEMIDLYQELVEKNLSDKSSVHKSI